MLRDALTLGGVPVALCALAAVVPIAGRPAAVVARALAVGAATWVAIVAAMTAGGFAGNPRYLVAAVAVLAALAGVGAVRLVTALRLPAATALGLPLAVGAFAAGGLADDVREVGVRADRRTELPRLVAAAGGRDALVSCAPVRTNPTARGLVAWTLDVPALGLDATPSPPAVVLQMREYDGSEVRPAIAAGAYRRLASRTGWTAWAACHG